MTRTGILLVMAVALLSAPLCMAMPITLRAGESYIFSFDFGAAGIVPQPPYDWVTWKLNWDSSSSSSDFSAYYIGWSELNARGSSISPLSSEFTIQGSEFNDGVFSVEVLVTSGSITVDPYSQGWLGGPTSLYTDKLFADNIPCLGFSTDTIPFSQVYYISDPGASPLRQVVGRMEPDDYRFFQSVPLPNVPGHQKFCHLLQLAPSLFAVAYVPVARERLGDFSSLLTGRQIDTDPLGRPMMEGAIYDPYTERIVDAQIVRDPFPGNIIPMSRLYDPYVWLVASLQARPVDLDGDQKSDIVVWRPSSGVWYTLPSNSPGTLTSTPWGVSTDVPVTGDYDGDGKSDVAVWRSESGTWFLQPSSFHGMHAAQPWGISSDKPVPADYDGDGKTDYAVWRPADGIWYIMPSTAPGTYRAESWGVSADIPVPADYDGDGKADIAVWRSSSGTWYTLPSNSPGNFTAVQWGVSTDKPAPGDYDGDGKTDIAVWRPGNGVWYVLPSSSAGTYIVRQWGVSTDIPVAADYDGDGKTDVAVWRPGSGVWYIMRSTDPMNYTIMQWGLPTDIPLSPLTPILGSLP